MNSRLYELFNKCYECENEESTWCENCPIKREIDILQQNGRTENENQRN